MTNVAKTDSQKKKILIMGVFRVQLRMEKVTLATFGLEHTSLTQSRGRVLLREESEQHRVICIYVIVFI